MTGRELKRARQALGLTQEQLAEEIGVAAARTVRRWENSERRIPAYAEKALQRIIQLRRGRGEAE